MTWYRRDWRASAARAHVVRTGNTLAGWCYRELLDAHWDTEDCALPDDDAQLASAAGVTLKKWLSVRALVLSWMTRTPEGKFRSRRAFFEWKKAKRNRGEHRRKAANAAKARWEKEKERRKAAIDKDAPSIAPSIASSMLEDCPPSPSPTPSPSPIKGTEDGTARPGGPPANPLIDRVALEREALRLVQAIAAVTGEDGTVVMARASGFNGSRKLNPAAMSDDRLANTVIDLKTEAARRGVPGVVAPDVERAKARASPTPAARARHEGLNAMAQGGMRDERELATRLGPAGGEPEGPGSDAGGADPPRGDLPAGVRKPG